MTDDTHRDTRDQSTRLAEDRTDWSEDRTILAVGRTFASWMRTGMASVALALGLKAVFGDFDPTWAAKAVATLFVALAIFVFWSAWLGACRANRRLNEHRTDSASNGTMTVIAAVLSVAAATTGVVLWLL